MIEFKNGELINTDTQEPIIQVGHSILDLANKKEYKEYEHKISGIDTSKFTEGERIYLDPDNLGAIISESEIIKRLEL